MTGPAPHQSLPGPIAHAFESVERSAPEDRAASLISVSHELGVASFQRLVRREQAEAAVRNFSSTYGLDAAPALRALSDAIDEQERSNESLLAPTHPRTSPPMSPPASCAATPRDDSVRPAPRPILVRLADVAPTRVTFLSEPRLPRGRLCILGGDPGLGKSMLTIDLAARLTRGEPTFGAAGGAAHGPVLIIQSEDGLADTVRPRLDAAGADVALIHSLTGTMCHVPGAKPGTGKDVPITFTLEDVDVLEGAITSTGAKLVIIDPLLAFIGARVDAHRMNETRPVLAGLAAIAEKHDATVLGLMHLSKAVGTKTLYRLLASVDFSAAARSVLLLVTNPDDATDRGRRLLLHVKCNLARKAPTIGFNVTDGRIEWTGEVGFTEADALAAETNSARRETKSKAAEEFLKDALLGGELPAKRVYEIAAGHGHSVKAVDRASRELLIEKRKDGKGPWFWRLPVAPEGVTSRAGAPVTTPMVSSLTHSSETVAAVASTEQSACLDRVPFRVEPVHSKATSVPGGSMLSSSVPFDEIADLNEADIPPDVSSTANGEMEGVGSEGDKEDSAGAVRARARVKRPHRTAAPPGELFDNKPDARECRRIQDGGIA